MLILRRCHGGVNHRLGPVERYRGPIGHIEWHLVGDDVDRIGRGLCFSGDSFSLLDIHFPPKGQKLFSRIVRDRRWSI